MTPKPCDSVVSCGISTSFPVLFPTERKVAHALLTRPPLEYSGASSLVSPLDLHVLSTPPAFVLSQDQTLSFNPVYIFTGHTSKTQLIRNYCLLFALFLVCIVFKVQCSLWGVSARVSLDILSNSQRKVNTFLMIFSTFLRSFLFSEQQQESVFIRPHISEHCPVY